MRDQSTKQATIEDGSYLFALQLVRAFRALPRQDDAGRVIWQQLLKAGTSAGANSAESLGAQSRADWLTKRFIALKEMREAFFWLRLLHDSSPPFPGHSELLDEANQLVAVLTATVKAARDKG
jgi:four helix bundle protein